MVIGRTDDSRPWVGCGLDAAVVATLGERVPQLRFLPFQTADQATELLDNPNCRLLAIDLTLVGDQATRIIAAQRETHSDSTKPMLYVVPQNRDSDLLQQLVHDRSTSQVLFQPLDVDELTYQISHALGIGIEESGEPTNEPGRQLQSAMAALWERFRETNLQRVETVEQATFAAQQGTLTAEERRAGERAAHKLTGAVGTFGFAAASQSARDIEQTLTGTDPLTPASLFRLSDLSFKLRRDLEHSPALPATPNGRPTTIRSNGRTARLLLVVQDAELAERIALAGHLRALDVDIALHFAEARQLIADRRPDVVLVDLAPADGSDRGMAFLAELANDDPPLPVVVLTQRDSLIDRVEVAALGGSAFLRKPLSPEQILDTVTEVLDSEQITESLILAVDDDHVILNSVQTILGSNGLQTVCLDDPLRFWDTLDETMPDLVVLDVDMPHVSGIELCKVIRNEQRWRALPVLILTAHTDPATVHRVFAAGADDYISKPFVGPELVNRISNRLERNRLYRRLAEVDALTGVSTRRKTSQVLERYLGLAQRRDDPFTLAILDVDHFKQINDRYGHASGDETLRRLGELLGQAFRREDVIGRWGGEEFVAGMYGMPEHVGVQRLTTVLEQFRRIVFRSPNGQEFHATMSAGVAQFPENGTDLASLYRTADSALYRAKANGRNRVVGTCQQPPPGSSVEHVDVLIAVDDDTLATPLRHALETQGYRVQWLPDGHLAIGALAGDHPHVRARLVLLSIDLPDVAGQTMLQEMRQTDLFKRSRVIVLSARGDETEELEAFELGLFDYVVKPVSLPILVQRIRRALND